MPPGRSLARRAKCVVQAAASQETHSLSACFTPLQFPSVRSSYAASSQTECQIPKVLLQFSWRAGSASDRRLELLSTKKGGQQLQPL